MIDDYREISLICKNVGLTLITQLYTYPSLRIFWIEIFAITLNSFHAFFLKTNYFWDFLEVVLINNTQGIIIYWFVVKSFMRCIYKDEQKVDLFSNKKSKRKRCTGYTIKIRNNNKLRSTFSVKAINIKQRITQEGEYNCNTHVWAQHPTKITEGAHKRKKDRKGMKQ